MLWEDFEGEWTLTKEIEDFLARTSPTFSGTARFLSTDYGYRYIETGELTSGGQVLKASREYAWHKTNQGADIHFTDGVFFHRLVFDATHNAQHFCAPDHYEVFYQLGEGKWIANWRVKGPKKDYLMRCAYSR